MTVQIPSRRGFTLIEILIATGIFMIVMVLAVAIFTTTTNGSSTGEQLIINAQAGRAAFESIAREIRLAHGLVYVDAADQRKKMLIQPFTISQSPIAITVYQVKSPADKQYNDAGERQYTLSRKQYTVQNNSLQVSDQCLDRQDEHCDASYWTVAQLKTALNTAGSLDSLSWVDSRHPSSPISKIDILSGSVKIQDFQILHQQGYVGYGEDVNNQLSQAFVQIKLIVANAQRTTRTTNEPVQTTLITTLVPRDFIGKYEVVQEGVQGTSD